MFRDTRQHIALGKITKLGVADDRSCLRVQAKLLDPSVEEDREVVAVMAWDDVGPECGVIRFPEVDDLVLLAFVDGHADECYVIKRLTSQEELIPLKALDGHTILAALAGKNVYLTSDTKIFIGMPDNEGTEPLVLGDILKTCITGIINAFLNASQIGQSAMGPVMLDPSVRTALQQELDNRVNDADQNFLSKLAFTERGGSS
jgi:hypothetical protein